MTHTIADVLNDLGIGDNLEKTASQNKEINQLDKLAMDLGVVEKNNENQVNQDTSLNKEASVKGLNDIYATLFPQDADLLEKSASANSQETEMEKEAAAIEEAKGAFAHDVFVNLVDAHITKIANDIVGKLPDNEDKSGKPAGTKEDVSDADKAMGHNPEGAVGHFRSTKQAALAQAFLKHSLGQDEE